MDPPRQNLSYSEVVLEVVYLAQCNWYKIIYWIGLNWIKLILLNATTQWVHKDWGLILGKTHTLVGPFTGYSTKRSLVMWSWLKLILDFSKHSNELQLIPHFCSIPKGNGYLSHGYLQHSSTLPVLSHIISYSYGDHLWTYFALKAHLSYKSMLQVLYFRESLTSKYFHSIWHSATLFLPS